MRALSVRQPWAECIARGVKTVENRSWSTTYRGPVAIHAGQQWAPDGLADRRVQRVFRDHVGVRPTHEQARGAIVAVVELVDAHRAGKLCGPSCWPWGDRADADPRGVHHLVLADARRLPLPIPMRGRLGLWVIPDDLIPAP